MFIGVSVMLLHSHCVGEGQTQFSLYCRDKQISVLVTNIHHYIVRLQQTINIELELIVDISPLLELRI